jgi:mono/diheme cytochrome c family protein
MRRLVLLATGLLALPACEVSSEFLQRMESQQRYSYYEETDFFPDRRAMRLPPENTVAREHPVGVPGISTGKVAGGYLTHFPIELDRAVLARGQHKYNIVCAQCHGLLGDGNSIVAENLAQRLPPNLLAVAQKPVGHFYTAITEGYGSMPSFAGEIEVRDRWAVVAYIRALQMARGALSPEGTPAGAPQNVPQETR